MKDRIELAKYFAKLGFKIGVEVGVLEGSYSRALCRYNPALKLYCVDSWGLFDKRRTKKKHHLKAYERAKNKLASYNATLIRESSIEAVKQFDDNSLDFVYIDANHSYGCVMEDITAWVPKVRGGGIVAGHDYQLPDVSKAVDEYMQDDNLKLMRTDCDRINPRTGEIEYSWYFIKA